MTQRWGRRSSEVCSKWSTRIELALIVTQSCFSLCLEGLVASASPPLFSLFRLLAYLNYTLRFLKRLKLLASSTTHFRPQAKIGPH